MNRNLGFLPTLVLVAFAIFPTVGMAEESTSRETNLAQGASTKPPDVSSGVILPAPSSWFGTIRFQAGFVGADYVLHIEEVSGSSVKCRLEVPNSRFGPKNEPCVDASLNGNVVTYTTPFQRTGQLEVAEDWRKRKFLRGTVTGPGPYGTVTGQADLYLEEKK